MNPPLRSTTKVILVTGGGGVLGKALISACKQEEVFFINISRNTSLIGENVYNHYCDLGLTDLEKIVSDIAQITPRLDYIVNAAYSRNFRSIATLEKKAFLEEIYLDSYVPIKLSLLCGQHFWSQTDRSHNIDNKRAVINISSGASFGKTKRPELASYGAAKAALNILTLYLHDELWDTYGVSAHTIHPGSFSDTNVLSNTVTTIRKIMSGESDTIHS